MLKGEVHAAIAAYNRAQGLATSEETRELLTIQKAEALIAVEREGPEISALPGIVMRRRSSRHVYMASSVLMRRFCESGDRRRAIFYGEIARGAAAELDDQFVRAVVLNNLGITLVEDSQFERATQMFEEALGVVKKLFKTNPNADTFSNNITLNLGGTRILSDEYEDGIALIESVLDQIDDTAWRAEGCLDLALGYLNLEDTETAEDLAREGLSLASTRRQIRNANHLLGEICLRTGRFDEADVHFDVVAGFYPGFSNVKQLLTEVNLCSVVNWKA